MSDEPSTNTTSHEIGAVIAQYEPELSAFIRTRIPISADVKDLLQDLWLHLSRSWTRKPIQNPRAWLFRVARNKIIDIYRRKSPEWLEDLLYEGEDDEWELDSEIEGWDPPEVMYLQEQFWEALYEALDNLPVKQREVFLLNELEGHTLKEIAEIKGENLKTIISRKGYAMRQLRRDLQLIFSEFVDYD